MARQWTFGQKIAAGFAVTLFLTLVMGAVAVYALQTVVASKDAVIGVNVRTVRDVEALEEVASRKSADARGFLLTRDPKFIELLTAAREEFSRTIDALHRSVRADADRALVDAVARADAAHNAALDRVIEQRRTDGTADAVAAEFERSVVPQRQAVKTALAALVARQEHLLDEGRRNASNTAANAIVGVVAIAAAAGLLALLIAIALTRTLARQVGTAVAQVQSSSAELQAAASQQASGSKEQATAMSEITTTITELLITSRQISESAQRVAQIAEDTAKSAKSGDRIVDVAHESIGSIRRQVDLVVGHMLELGKSSQQIGAVLDIVSELAEQTNILAINATIEAAGAGDAGKRFAVVADEIRKLADRVATATKDIRGLIDDVRAAVNTTVMATETGSKAVDAGSKQFAEVASSFQQIASMVATTTEAAREIELSTKQQTSAVEQVNTAVANVAQATKESESSASQTSQTASQLAVLSKDLLRLVQPQPGA